MCKWATWDMFTLCSTWTSLDKIKCWVCENSESCANHVPDIRSCSRVAHNDDVQFQFQNRSSSDFQVLCEVGIEPKALIKELWCRNWNWIGIDFAGIAHHCSKYLFFSQTRCLEPKISGRTCGTGTFRQPHEMSPWVHLFILVICMVYTSHALLMSPFVSQLIQPFYLYMGGICLYLGGKPVLYRMTCVNSCWKISPDINLSCAKQQKTHHFQATK